MMATVVMPLPAAEVSVVIPTCGRPALLRRCLEALLRQTFAATAFEIIVVDDGRSPDTHAAVQELAGRPGVPLIRYVTPAPGSKGPAGARNAGWRASEAELIAFTDDDTIPQPDWLERGVAALRASSSRAAVWGHVSVPIPPHRPTDNERNTKGLEGATFVTANVFVRRAAMEAVGGFDERFKRAWREDTDLYFALLGTGMEVAPARDAVVLHPAREAPWGVSMKQQANMAFDALLYKKYPRLYREQVQPGPPWRYYLIVGCTLAAIAALALREPAWAAGLGAVALMGVARLIWRRLRGASLAPAHVSDMVLTSFALPFLSVYWRIRGALQFKVLFW
jgi:cellulose synthase/poly-beta-1,6-N-acetylglucosamine synthase-like glycosyltransferase